MDTVFPQALGSDIEYPLWSNTLSAKSILGGRVALTLWDGGLIAEMEREVMEAGAGGWFNRMPQEGPETWSGPNSDTLASQDQVRTTLLTTIGG